MALSPDHLQCLLFKITLLNGYGISAIQGPNVDFRQSSL